MLPDLGESEVSDVDKESFLKKVYCPYVQNVIDHISTWLKASNTFAASSVFDPRHLPSTEDYLSTYGTEKLQILTKFYDCEQKVTFDGETEISIPREETNSGRSINEYYSTNLGTELILAMSLIVLALGLGELFLNQFENNR